MSLFPLQRIRVVPVLAGFLFAVQLGLFLGALGRHVAWSSDHAPTWDELDYLYQAHELYASPSLDTMRRSVRPIFSWPGILILRALGIPFSRGALILASSVVYQFLLLVGLLGLFRLLGLSRLGALAAASVLWGMPYFYFLSHVLLGDLPLTAWIVLAIYLFVRLYVKGPTPIGAVGTGLALAAGLLIKPFFVTFAVEAAAVFLATAFVRNRLRERPVPWRMMWLRGEGALLVAAALAAGSALFPWGLPALFRWLYEVNQVLGYWADQSSGLRGALLWLPGWFFEGISLPVSLTLIGGAFLFLLPRAARLIPAAGGSGAWALLRRGLSLPAAPLAALFLAHVALVSVWMSTRDIRTTFFLYPLCLVLWFGAMEWAAGTSFRSVRVFRGVCLFVLSLNVLGVASHVGPHGWWSTPVLRAFLDIRVPSVTRTAPVTREVKYTYERLGITRVMEFLAAHCRPGCEEEETRVFFPHSSFLFNDSLFQGFSFVETYLGRPPVFLDGTRLTIEAPGFIHGFNGKGGGIPGAFFRDRYVLLVKDHLERHLPDAKAESYLVALAERLSRSDPDFLDGLREILRFDNAFGHTIVVYERVRFPTAESFSRMVASLTERDPHNVWNTFYLVAALNADPAQGALRRQLDRMTGEGFLDGIRYPYGSEERRAWVEEVLRRPFDNRFSKVLRSPEATAAFFCDPDCPSSNWLESPHRRAAPEIPLGEPLAGR